MGHNIAGTNVNIDDKDKSYGTFTSNILAIRWYQTMVITITITKRMIIIKLLLSERERYKQSIPKQWKK